jgi:general secretion pathway protein A
MERYIYHRLWRAGSNRSLSFTKRALKTIYKHSQGYPRLVNIICDRALMEGCNKRSRSITKKMVQTATGKLGIGKTKTGFRPFPVPAKLIGLTIVGLMLIAAIAYFIRSWSFVVGSADNMEESINLPSESAINDTPQDIDNAPTDGFETQAAKVIPDLSPQTDSKPQKPAFSHSASARGRDYWLQVHSLQSQQKADMAAAELKGHGYQTKQRIVTNPDGTSWFVVYVGPFADIGNAQEAAETIQEKEQLTAILRSLPSSGALYTQ